MKVLTSNVLSLRLVELPELLMVCELKTTVKFLHKEKMADNLDSAPELPAVLQNYTQMCSIFCLSSTVSCTCNRSSANRPPLPASPPHPSHSGHGHANTPCRTLAHFALQSEVEHDKEPSLHR